MGVQDGRPNSLTPSLSPPLGAGGGGASAGECAVYPSNPAAGGGAFCRTGQGDRVTPPLWAAAARLARTQWDQNRLTYPRVGGALTGLTQNP
jgi:hypothetical protein